MAVVLSPSSPSLVVLMNSCLLMLLPLRPSDDFEAEHPEVVVLRDEVLFVDPDRNQAKLASGGVLQFTRWAHPFLGLSHLVPAPSCIDIFLPD